MLTRILTIFLSFLLITVLFTSPVYAAIVNPTPKPCPSDPASVAKFGPCPASLNEFEQVIGGLVSVIVGLAFVATLIMLVMAGFKYLTSGGEPKAIQAAHQTATWALLGILFLAAAWVILLLVQAFTGINVTVFNIKTLCSAGGLQFCNP